MNKFCFVRYLVPFALLVMTSLAASTDIDISTGELIVKPAFTPIPENMDNDQILWDLTHGIYLSYDPSGNYSNLTSILAGEGFDMETTTLGVNNIDLTPYEVIVINTLTSWDSQYQAAEVTALVDFVNSGGGLLIMSDNDGCHNANIQPVSSAFGTTVGLGTSEPSDLYFTNFVSHRIFDGITTIYYLVAGALSCVSPSVEAAWSPSYADVMVSLVDPSPRIVVLSDANVFSNDDYSTSDNIDFSINIFHYLAGHGVSLQNDTWGTIKTIAY